MQRARETVAYSPTVRLTAGAFAWVIQRVTSILLLVAVPLKIFSGYAAVGKVPLPTLAPLHRSPWLDVVILFSLIFHTLYGLRVILVEHGLATKSVWLFRLLTAVGLVLCLSSLAVIW